MIKIITKIPILLVALFVSIMFVIDATNIVDSYHFQYQWIISLALFVAGLLVITVGGLLFKKANTTVNPMTPEKSTQLVTTGIYRYSRNPMYIGFLAWLLAAALFIGNPLGLLLLPPFIWLVNKLYIYPEEKALEKLFGDEFSIYKSEVGRWL